MENRFYNRDFEQLVKNSADQYRMFPSEKVWYGIHNRLHKRRRWYGAGLAFLLLSIGTVTWVMLTNPSNKNLAEKNIIGQNITAKKPVANKQAEKEIFIAPKITKGIDANSSISSSLPAITSVTTLLNNNDLQPEMPDTDNSGNADESIYAEVHPVVASPVSQTKAVVANVSKTDLTAKVVKESEVAKVNDKSLQLSPNDNNFISISDYHMPEEVDKNTEKNGKGEITIALHNNWPLTIESVVNSYVRKAARNKISWQLYFTPSITYRSLKENKSFIKSARAAASPISGNSPASVSYYFPDLEQVVIHKPDLGFQVGTTAGLSISRRLNFVTGLQFNVNKYDIKAYSHTTEVATISLNTLGRSSSVSTVTSYRVIGGGYNANWLRNFYFSASVPVGLEYIVAKSKKNYVGISGTVQPTYVLDNKSYLVSTDYKNYAQAPSLTRHWNVNTGAELFVGIVGKKTEWRISPQARYQTLSSYKNKYPVKENLFDFGLKMGVMLR